MSNHFQRSQLFHLRLFRFIFCLSTPRCETFGNGSGTNR
jgi:hypothetical protein